MNATPAGWYDDPEEPGQQRYWDGSAWTERRGGGASTPTPPAPPAPSATAPTTPPPGAFTPPPAPAGTRSSRKWLWIGLSVGVLVLVLVGVAVVALIASQDDPTEVVEENLPAALEVNLRVNGLDVTVSEADCDEISDSEGPFTTTCDISIDGLSAPLEATVYGSIDGTTVNVDDVQSDKLLLNTELATEQAQSGLDTLDPTVKVLSCTLSEPVVLVEEGLRFSCELDTDETVTFEVQDGQLTIADVL